MNRKIIIQRGEKEDFFMHEFEMESGPGMVVLDAIHHIQANDAPDLAVRWNCKAGKCGSCSAEVNGEPKLMCMTRMSDYDSSEPLVIKPMKTFPVIKDLVTDVSWNYEVNKKILPYQHPETEDPRMLQEDVDRVQEFRKCIECFLCQDVCHVLRDSDMKAEYACSSRFDVSKCTNKGARHRNATYWEIENSPLSACTPQGRLRNFHFSHCIRFGTSIWVRR